MKSLSLPGTATGYINRTLGAATNALKYTLSAWVKRGTVGTAQSWFNADNGHTDTGWCNLTFNASNQLSLGGFSTTWRVSSAAFADTGAWHHLLIAVDTTQSTAANRIRIYWDGAEITSWGTNNAPALNAATGYNSAAIHIFGRDNVANQPANGKIAQVWFVDGQQLDPSYFTSSVGGVLGAKPYTGALGTNGFFLSFANSSTLAALGNDDDSG